MRIGMLGTGSVGQALATRLVELGHDVCMGSRGSGNENASEWAKTAGAGSSFGTFADAASFGELLFNCTAGAHSLEALAAAGEDAIAGKVLVDVANPLDFSQGTLALTVTNTDSLAEQIQRAFPRARVVKALNTVNYKLMADPSILETRTTSSYAETTPRRRRRSLICSPRSAGSGITSSTWERLMQRVEWRRTCCSGSGSPSFPKARS